MKGSALVVILFICFPNFAKGTEVCDEPDSNEVVRIYFANGMNNQYSTRIENMEEIKGLFLGKNYEFGIAENHDESAIVEIMEAYRQKLNEPKTFWQWMSNHALAPEWFQQAYAQRVDEIASRQVQSDTDLHKMLYGGNDEAGKFQSGIINSLYVGKKVVLVAHSQGNLYSNVIYQYIKSKYPQYKDSIGIVAVGSPSNHVNGPTVYRSDLGNLANAPYTTNTRDHVMNAIRVAAIFVGIDPPLPANVTYNQPFNFKNHSFIDTYLKAFSGRIKGHIENMVAELEFPKVLSVCEDQIPDFPKIVTLNAQYVNATTNTLVNLPGRIDKGKNLSVWTIWDWGKSIPIPTCKSSNASNEGTFNVGDIANFRTVAQWNTPQEWVTYRKCAINSIGQISDGGVKTFQSTRR